MTERLQAIYQPKGRAAEYAKWAVNLYSGCTHGCVYCYAPLAMHRDRATFHARRTDRNRIIEAIEHDAGILMRDGVADPILLCFSCDPYQPGAELTRAALATLCAHGLHFTVLTKGELAWCDFNVYGPGDSFGVTLTLDNDRDSAAWEPGAATPGVRIGNLFLAHRQGIRTWASLEPVIYPEQTLALIDRTHEFVDHYKVGRLNYHPHAATIDWPKFLRDVTEKLDLYGASYYIKQDLAEFKEVRG